jgi:hypothetical protein
MSELTSNQTRRVVITPKLRGTEDQTMSLDWVEGAMTQISPLISTTRIGPSVVATVPNSISDEHVRTALGTNFFVATDQPLQYGLRSKEP